MAARVGKAGGAGGPAGGTSSTPSTTASTKGGTPVAEDQGAPAKSAGQKKPTTPAGDSGKKKASSTPPAAQARQALSAVGGNATINMGAGFLLGLAFWVLIGLPLLQGGPSAVRDQLRAKFFNKDSKGNWLP